MRPGGRTGNRSVREGDGLAFEVTNDSEARAAQRRVNAEDDFIHSDRLQRRGEGWRRSARRCAGDAFLHLPELLERDAHARESVRRAPDSKVKTPALGGRNDSGGKQLRRSIRLTIAAIAIVPTTATGIRTAWRGLIRRGR